MSGDTVSGQRTEKVLPEQMTQTGGWKRKLTRSQSWWRESQRQVWAGPSPCSLRGGSFLPLPDSGGRAFLATWLQSLPVSLHGHPLCASHGDTCPWLSCLHGLISDPSLTHICKEPFSKGPVHRSEG